MQEKLRSVGNVSGLCHTTIAKLQPHARQQSDKLVFQYCGDHYGACHNLGTKFGKHPWVNPVVLKAIAVKTSSPPGRCTIPKVGRQDCLKTSTEDSKLLLISDVFPEQLVVMRLLTCWILEMGCS